jgi:PAS domain S-box-containing protein
MVLDILDGKPVTALPVRTNLPQEYRVDHRALKRWGLSEAALPAGTTVLFRTPSLWDQHHSVVLSVLAAFGLQSLVVAVLLIQIRRRHAAERSLRESEARFRSMADSAPLLIWISDADRRCTFVNKSWLNFTGRACDRELGDGWAERLHPDEAAQCLSTYAHAFDARREFAMEYRLRRRDGEFRSMFHKGVPRHAADGRFLGYIGIADDITDRRHAEEQAAEQRREVAHLMRVSVVGELSGAIAHEINQPLTAILTNAETGLDLLAEAPPDIAELREVFQDIVQDDCRAAAVLQRVRGLLKKEERQFETVDLNDLVQATLALLHSELIGRKISVALGLAGGLPPTYGDPVQLQQVLLNLMMNAMDAMTSMPVSQRVVTVATRAVPAGTIELSIADRGPGLPAAEQGRLFEPFYTTKPHGLGLGLAICASIVKQHGGLIRIVNGDSGGALATLSLPGEAMLMAAQ